LGVPAAKVEAKSKDKSTASATKGKAKGKLPVGPRLGKSRPDRVKGKSRPSDKKS
jgi:hypothetical protein